MTSTSSAPRSSGSEMVRARWSRRSIPIRSSAALAPGSAGSPSDSGPAEPTVAAGQAEQRVEPADALEPAALLAEAARAAQADSGSDRLLAALDAIAVIHIVSKHYRDPAAVVAAALGISPAR